jgi:hypothetical protein
MPVTLASQEVVTEDHDFRPAQAKSPGDPISTNKKLGVAYLSLPAPWEA